MTEFGASFKRARESLGVTLNQIAIETRISTRFLLAIENEDFRRLPGGIFNRGFIRTYAERVGLNPEEAVADYERLAQNTEPDALIRSAEPPMNVTPRSLYVVTVVILGLLIVGFYVFSRTPTATSESETVPGIVENAPVVAQPTPIAQSPEPEKVDPPTPEPTPVVASFDPVPQAPPPAPSAAPATNGPLALEVEVHELTWIKISTDGSAVLNKEVQPGTTLRYTAQGSIDLVVGNAGGLSMKLNDKPIAPLGRSGQVRSLRITPDNLADIIG